MANAKPVAHDPEAEPVKVSRRDRLIEMSRRWQKAARRREDATDVALRIATAKFPKPFNRARAIIEEVAERHGTASADILGRCKTDKIVAARDDAIAEVYKRCLIEGRPYTLLDLSRLFKRHHTTCLHSLRKAGLK